MPNVDHHNQIKEIFNFCDCFVWLLNGKICKFEFIKLTLEARWIYSSLWSEAITLLKSQRSYLWSKATTVCYGHRPNFLKSKEGFLVFEVTVCCGHRTQLLKSQSWSPRHRIRSVYELLEELRVHVDWCHHELKRPVYSHSHGIPSSPGTS